MRGFSSLFNFPLIRVVFVPLFLIQTFLPLSGGSSPWQSSPARRPGRGGPETSIFFFAKRKAITIAGMNSETVKQKCACLPTFNVNPIRS